jgi:hypothetical protein
MYSKCRADKTMEVLSILPINKMGCNTHGAFSDQHFRGRTRNLKIRGFRRLVLQKVICSLLITVVSGSSKLCVGKRPILLI